ncbi:Na+/H+ antiporter NhaC [Celerinatantimonas diazotrophica]|uniref:Transporter (NhaC family) n=1 Tax=Celerinatantimonas diazotrophica TaxID=412034 RepID=A0A4R1JA28_9GAMM|nr:Na+/H+ antiporter NhaC [Celerinatantimonas diazotrophica]TCK47458.1 transporter (NhaC family) [Celerinatantimonas diazotrophica]CAG9294922.1 Na(+)/H(+) antiporter NhaC [Celerinatantimonas diazotrophica]
MATISSPETDPSLCKLPSFPLAITPIILTLMLLGLQIFYFGDFTPHIPLALGLAITSLVGLKQGLKWKDIEQGMLHVVSLALPSIAVLICVGMLIGTWIASGTVPTLIYYGLTMLSPHIFLAAAMLLCSVVSLALGTSWGTVGTVGLALMGIGSGFNIPMYWTAGAVVSGAFFGDKMSPLSDTTNLSPAVTGTDVFSHIRNMIPTTLPAMIIAFLIYLVAGFVMIHSGQSSFDNIASVTQSLESHFNLSVWLLLPALLVIALAVKRMPPIPSLFAGVLAGGATAMIAQGAGLHDVFTFASSGYNIHTNVDAVNSLLNRGGIQSMMWTVSLILIALSFGGALEKTRCLEAIIRAIVNRVSKFAQLQTAAACASMATNLVAGDPYLSIALPGRMFAPAYRGIKYSTLNLARALEEGGTLISPLVPWNAGGAFVISALGLGISQGNFENLLYIPLAFACWLSPLTGILFANLGIFSPKATKKERQEWRDKNELIAAIEGID